MANRTYLYCSDKPVKYIDLGAEIIISAANYMVPVFWYMLFDESCIEKVSTPCDDNEPDFNYFRLCAPKASSIERAKQRISSLSNVLGAGIMEQFNQFIDHLMVQPGQWVVVETCELAMMDTSAHNHKKEAKKCVKAFSQELIIQKGFFKKRPVVNPNWVVLLGQANISGTDHHPIESLCGYSWQNSVPWETNSA